MVKKDCGKECEVMSRVVGYYRPTRQWHAGKQEEFKQRKEYCEKKSLKHNFTNEKTGEEVNKEKLTAFAE
jgi:hypothetical protein